MVQTIVTHSSVRSFRRDPLPAEHLEVMREAMRRGPSSSALQTYTVVFVTDPALRERVAVFCDGQRWVVDCGLFVIACSDHRRVALAAHERGYPYRADDLRMLISSTEDVAIAVQNASLAAQSVGLGTVMIGGVLNGTREIAAELALPPRVVPLLGLCVGFPAAAGSDLPRPRLPLAVVFHENRFELEHDRERDLIAEHDRELADSGFYAGRRIGYGEIGGSGDDPTPDDQYGWSEHVARKQARTWWLSAGTKLRADLAALGLKLVS